MTPHTSARRAAPPKGAATSQAIDGIASRLGFYSANQAASAAGRTPVLVEDTSDLTTTCGEVEAPAGPLGAAQ